jgi:hypothetical protein
MKQILLAFLVAGSFAACQSSVNAAHGEEGHKCDSVCSAQHHATDSLGKTTDMVLKEHVCTEACKEGTHEYSHGENGHTCTEACKNQPGK